MDSASRSNRATPPGWPADLPAPDDPEFDQRVVAWLLDRLPAQFRGERALTARPIALAQLADDLVRGQVEGARTAYSRARVRLAELDAPAKDVDAVLQSLEHAGAGLARTQAEVALVCNELERRGR